MSYFKTNGIVFKTKDSGEKDKLVWILTDHKGKLMAVAKGVKKVGSRRAGHLDLFSYCNFTIHHSSSFDTISDLSPISYIGDLRKKFTYHLFFLAEILDRLTFDEYEGRTIFELIKVLFSEIPGSKFLLAFSFIEINLLKIIGFHPNLETYSDTNERFSMDNPIYVTTEVPGYASRGSSTATVHPNVIKSQRFLISQPFEIATSLNIDESLQKQISSIHKLWIQSVFDRKFNSLEFLYLDNSK